MGQPDVARKVLDAVGQRRVATQIKPDGSQPLELGRTKSWDYSCANTRNFVNLAELGRRTGVDIWGYETEDGRSIRKAIDFLLPYVMNEKAWSHKQISEFSPKPLLVPLLQAARHDQTGRYAKAARKLLSDDAVEHLLYAPPAP